VRFRGLAGHLDPLVEHILATTMSEQLVVVVDDGVLLAWPMVELLGHGRLRRIVERDLRHHAGGTMPLVLVELFDQLDAACRVVSPASDRCVVPSSSHEHVRQLESIDVAEAARRLGVGQEAVRARIRRHTLQAWQDDAGRWRIPLELNTWPTRNDVPR